jgi:hypothetical protein
MKAIESALLPITGYLISITRNTVDGWYELEIGIPKGWVYDEHHKDINCEIIDENETGKLIKISPKNNSVEIDDLVIFVEIILEINKKIAEKEREFTDKMQELKGVLENEAKKFYGELDELKVNSFKNLNINFEKTLHPEEKKKRRSRKQKIVTVSGGTETNNTVTELVKE